MSDNNLSVIKDISENIEAICIVDFINAESRELLDKKFKELTGFTITSGGPHYPWVPVKYTNATVHLDSNKGIPQDLERINVIWAKHIGVAHEIIFIGKLNREVEKSEVRRYFEAGLKNEIAGQLLYRYSEREGDRSSYDKFKTEVERAVSDYIVGKSIESLEGKIIFNELKSIVPDIEVNLSRGQLETVYLSSKLRYFKDVQKKLEKYAVTIVPGIFFSRPMQNGGNKCISIWIYEIPSQYNPLAERKPTIFEAGLTLTDYSKVIQWIGAFERDATTLDYKSNDLSLLGLETEKLEEKPISIIEKKFVIGHGTEAKPDEMGAYTNRYIIFRLEKNSEFYGFKGVNLENILTDLTKFLLPLHWTRLRNSELEHFDSVIEEFEIPVLNHVSSKDLINSLKNVMSSYNKGQELMRENKKLFDKIDTELLYFTSLRDNIVKIVGEQENTLLLGNDPNISMSITKDTDFWMHKLSKRLERIKIKEEERFHYLHNHINVLSSYLNANLQDSVEKYTKWVMGFTVGIFIFTVAIFILTLSTVIL